MVGARNPYLISPKWPLNRAKQSDSNNDNKYNDDNNNSNNNDDDTNNNSNNNSNNFKMKLLMIMMMVIMTKKNLNEDWKKMHKQKSDNSSNYVENNKVNKSY